MNKELEAIWKAAEDNPGTPMDLGRIVVCDFCDADHTNTTVSGGLIFGSKAICPECVPKVESEPQYIKARCPAGQSFGDFVRAYRGANNSIVIRTSADIPAAPSARCACCKQPFTSNNVFTAAGRAEISISGICELCFDKLFSEEGEDESDG